MEGGVAFWVVMVRTKEATEGDNLPKTLDFGEPEANRNEARTTCGFNMTSEVAWLQGGDGDNQPRIVQISQYRRHRAVTETRVPTMD